MLRNNRGKKKVAGSQLEKYKALERTSCLRGQVQGSSVKNRAPPRPANTGLGPLVLSFLNRFDRRDNLI